MLYKFFGPTSGPDAVRLLGHICETNTLRASDPTTFNDPFEFKVVLDLDAEEDVIRCRYFEDNPANSESDYVSWKSGLTPHFKRWLAQDTRYKLLSTFGVICFTTIVDNHLLWSHYAAQHQGFCLGFDELIVEDLLGRQCWGPVTYQADAPKFSYFYDSPSTFVKQTFGYKSDCWAYENEYRVVLDHQGIIPFGKGHLREVILGCRAYRELQYYADMQLGSADYGYFKMVENFNAYSLRKVPMEKGISFIR